MRPGRQRRRGLVEADVAVAADPEDLQIDPAGLQDRGLEALALGFEIGGAPVEEMNRSRPHIDMPEQVLAHVGAIAAGMLRIEADELVEIEGCDLRVIRLAA